MFLRNRFMFYRILFSFNSDYIETNKLKKNEYMRFFWMVFVFKLYVIYKCSQTI